MTSELETNIVAVERLKEYSETPTEGSNTHRIPPNVKEWPQKGAIDIHDLSLRCESLVFEFCRYRPGLDLVLKGVSVHIKPEEKVGIVGRTGAGKSSLTLALFRIVEADQGKILIDGENIGDMELEVENFETYSIQVLRSRLTIVPQDPVLFSGTLRLNLDPFGNFDDASIWRALQNAHLQPFVSSLPDQLQHAINEGGENLRCACQFSDDLFVVWDRDSSSAWPALS